MSQRAAQAPVLFLTRPPLSLEFLSAIFMFMADPLRSHYPTLCLGRASGGRLQDGRLFGFAVVDDGEDNNSVLLSFLTSVPTPCGLRKHPYGRFVDRIGGIFTNVNMLGKQMGVKKDSLDSEPYLGEFFSYFGTECAPQNVLDISTADFSLAASKTRNIFISFGVSSP